LSGRMGIEISKTSFSPNESIEGTLTLNLDKPTKSKGVFVSLTSGESRNTYRNGKSVTEHYTRVWSSLPLDVEKEYSAAQVFTYPFKFVAPTRSAPFDPIAMLWKFIRKDTTPRSKSYKIEAKLDISHGFDVNSSRNIEISYT
jgi:hypothetical protein